MVLLTLPNPSVSRLVLTISRTWHRQNSCIWRNAAAHTEHANCPFPLDIKPEFKRFPFPVGTAWGDMTITSGWGWLSMCSRVATQPQLHLLPDPLCSLISWALLLILTQLGLLFGRYRTEKVTKEAIQVLLMAL